MVIAHSLLGAVLVLGTATIQGDVACTGYKAASKDTLDSAKRTADALREALECHERMVLQAESSAWAWEQIGRGRLRLSLLGGQAVGGIQQPLGVSNAEGAVRALLMALTIDPGRGSVVRPLLDALEAESDWAHYGDAAESLRRMPEGEGAPRNLLLRVRLMLERHIGGRDSSLAIAQRLARTQTDSALALFELAREMFFAGKAAQATAVYWRGARAARSERARAAYLGNAFLVARPGEQEDLLREYGADTEALLRRFWSRRDGEAGQEAGSRLELHFRRLEYVLQNFRLRRKSRRSYTVARVLESDTPTPASRLTDPLENASGSPALLTAEGAVHVDSLASTLSVDRRGIFYLRLGPPDQRAGYWWLYRRGGDALMVAVTGVQDRLSGTKCDLLPQYCWAENGGKVSAQVRQRWRASEMAMAKRAATLEGFSQAYETELKATARIMGVRLAGGVSGILVAGIVDMESADAADGRQSASAQLRLIVRAANQRGEDWHKDTTLTIAVRAPQETWVSFLEQLPVPAGSYTVAVSVMKGQLAGAVRREEGYQPALISGAGATLSQATEVTVPGSRGNPELADLVVGDANSPLTWQSDRASVPVSPTGVFREGSTLRVFAQAGGLLSGGDYQAQLSLERVDTEGRGPATLRFPLKADAGSSALDYQMPLLRTQRGLYRLTLSLLGSDGRELTSRSTLLSIR